MFDIGNDYFEHINIQTINKWINIAKYIIRSSKRKHQDERQHNLTKLFTLQPSSKTNKSTLINFVALKKIIRQTPINQLFSKTPNLTHIPPSYHVDSCLGSGKNAARSNQNNIISPWYPIHHGTETIPNVRPPMKNKIIKELNTLIRKYHSFNQDLYQSEHQQCLKYLR